LRSRGASRPRVRPEYAQFMKKADPARHVELSKQRN